MVCQGNAGNRRLGHVVLGTGADAPTVLDHLCGCLSGFFDIEPSTFQLETRDRRRFEEASHP
jgi:hypothetical protein